IPTAPSHPIFAGSYGSVSTVLTGDPGYFDSLGSYATGLATFSFYGGLAVAAIPPGALSPTSGAVVFVSDVNAFDNARLSRSGYDNQTLALNALAYVAPANHAPTANAGGPYATT